VWVLTISEWLARSCDECSEDGEQRGQNDDTDAESACPVLLRVLENLPGQFVVVGPHACGAYIIGEKARTSNLPL
jgi:hypothetical protein